VKTESETLYIEANLEAGATLDLPVVEELGVYVVSGSIGIDGETVTEGVLAILSSNTGATVSSQSGARVMLFGGAALEGERILWWNFVSSSRERMEQAKNDWREGRFAEVPGESDFIPLPTN
jgi:hypothetical protein